MGLGSPALNGNPAVDESGAVRGPSSNDCNVARLLLIGVDGGVKPSASVVSSQMGNAPMPPIGEVMGAERETFIIIVECGRVTRPLLGRGTAIALDDAGVGVLGAGG